jgi:hypothetical protein
VRILWGRCTPGNGVSVWTALHLLLELHPRVLEVAAAPHQQAAVEEESREERELLRRCRKVEVRCQTLASLASES